MAHDPYCTYAKTPKEVEWHLCACCAWVKEIRNDERFATVESAVYIASQSGASRQLHGPEGPCLSVASPLAVGVAPISP